MSDGPRAVRSLVFVPAHDGDRILSIATRGMDAICLDLEDLTPLAQKEEARAIFRDVARRLVAMGVMVFARTNGLAGGMARDDLAAIVGPEVHCDIGSAGHPHSSRVRSRTGRCSFPPDC